MLIEQVQLWNRDVFVPIDHVFASSARDDPSWWHLQADAAKHQHHVVVDDLEVLDTQHR